MPWRSEKILDYNLFYHPELEFEHASEKDFDLYLLGFIFDFENPAFSNKQILDSLSRTNSFDNFIDHLSKYSGHYVIIYRLNKRLILINDACAQQEIYYDISYSSFGSQPILLGKVIRLLPHSSVEAAGFYASSPFFLKQKLFIGETTHVENIKHLRPNHYIDIELKSIIRFFPKVPIKPKSINEVATEACEMLKGFIKAASLRNKLYMGVTGGYDTRVLFLASLDIDCKYYVSKLSNMNDGDPEIVIPQKLTQIFNKQFRVVVESPVDNYAMLVLNMSVDFPRELYKPDERI